VEGSTPRLQGEVLRVKNLDLVEKCDQKLETLLKNFQNFVDEEKIFLRDLEK
jgi:hypothetical protein